MTKESNAHTEGESTPNRPTPMSSAEKRAFAIRKYHGLGPDGEFVETWTQQEIADYLGVARRSINRWVNEEPLPLVDDLGRRERVYLFTMIVTGNEYLDRYLDLLELEGRI